MKSAPKNSRRASCFARGCRSLRATPIAGSALAKAAWAFPLAGLVGRHHWRRGLCAGASDRIAAVAGRGACRRGDDACRPAACMRTGSPTPPTVLAAAHTREQKLEIMRDSHIGAYGVCALTIVALPPRRRAGEPAERACGRVGADRLARRGARDHAGADVACCRRRAATGCRTMPASRRRGRRRRRGARLFSFSPSVCIRATRIAALILLAVIVAAAGVAERAPDRRPDRRRARRARTGERDRHPAGRAG